MTIESDNKDRRVSEAYRDLASEITSPDLDDKILAMAASDARTRYGLVRLWIRPVAWIATIGLSFAFILELSRYPGSPLQTPVEFEGAPDDEVIRDESIALDKDLAATAEYEGRVRQEPDSRSDVPAPSRMKLAPAKVSPAAATEITSLSRTAKDETLPDKAEESSRQGAGKEALGEANEQAQNCEETIRATAESWYECIEDLRDNGLDEAARTELEALMTAFPDFPAARPE